MAIEYTIVKQQGPPGSDYEEQDLYYARARSTKEIDTKQLAEQIQKMSTVSPGDVMAVLYGLREVMSEELANGNLVRLEGVGTFRISISSKAATKPDKITPKNFRPPRLNYRPAPQLKEMLKGLEFQQQESSNS
jgi:predicted histone-like DNA-binding protein